VSRGTPRYFISNVSNIIRYFFVVDFMSQMNFFHVLYRRGLSKYYKGKSKTFRSLSDCKCLEDLSKKEIALKKKAHSSFHSPKADISKKAGRSCFTSLLYKLN
jgi:hypothetical protein